MNEKMEIEGDLRDEYQAIQQAELAESLNEQVEILEDGEIKELLQEMWEEFVPIKDEEYTDEDAFRDFYMDQVEDFTE